MTNEDKFFEWWNGDEMADDLDVVKHTPLYWAMQGWEAANRQPWVKTYSGGKPNYTQPCERCGEVNPAEIHTCTPKQQESRKDKIVKFSDFIDANPSYFKKQKEWFIENWHVVEAFESVALKLIGMNRTHYSARTIVEVLVHQSAVKEINGDYKIGNDNAPDLARVFVVLHPKYVDFWEYRRPDWASFKNMFNND